LLVSLVPGFDCARCAGSFPCYKTKGFLRLRPEVAVCAVGSLPAPLTASTRRDCLPAVACPDFLVLASADFFVAFVFIACPPGSVLRSVEAHSYCGSTWRHYASPALADR